MMELWCRKARRPTGSAFGVIDGSISKALLRGGAHEDLELWQYMSSTSARFIKILERVEVAIIPSIQQWQKGLRLP